MKAFFHKKYIEAGCDEAGRGCLAGPVFAAAVILPKDFYHPKLKDSKLLKEADREELRPYIEKHAISYSVQSVDEREICLLYTSPSPRDQRGSRMPSSA